MPKMNSIKTRYVITGFAISLISILSVSLISYFVSHRITSDLSDKRIHETAKRISSEFDSWFRTRELIVESLADNISASGDFSKVSLCRLLRKKKKRYSGEIQDFYIAFENSRSILNLSGWVPLADYNPHQRSWYIAALKSEKVIITEPYVDSMTGALVVSVAKSLKKNGKIAGVIGADINITELIRVVNSLKVLEKSYAMLLDENGRIIAHPEKSFLPTKKGLRNPEDIDWPEYRKMLSLLQKKGPGQKMNLRNYQGEKGFYIFSRIHKSNWFFGIAVKQSEYNKPLDSLLIGFTVAFMISIIVGILIMYRLMNGMLDPLKHLYSAVSSFSAEDMSARAPVTTTDEIGILSLSFNKMADIIQEYSTSLENRVEERTRELKEKNDLLMESIDYAARLQNAVLPDPGEVFDLDSEKYFVIWKPKDTVGGDIFWCSSKENRKLIVLADCTGHGVPGALMAMTLSSMLDSVAREISFDSPAEFMELLNQRLKNTLGLDKEDTGVHDGAEVAMLMINESEGQLVFSGAGMSVYEVFGGEVKEFRGIKNSLGYSFRKKTVFRDEVISYRKGAVYFFSTDGFTDQNDEPGKGGMGRSGFMEMLGDISGLPVQNQKKAILNEIYSRLKSVPQRDDITILAIEI